MKITLNINKVNTEYVLNYLFNINQKGDGHFNILHNEVAAFE